MIDSLNDLLLLMTVELNQFATDLPYLLAIFTAFPGS